MNKNVHNISFWTTRITLNTLNNANQLYPHNLGQAMHSTVSLFNFLKKLICVRENLTNGTLRIRFVMHIFMHGVQNIGVHIPAKISIEITLKLPFFPKIKEVEEVITSSITSSILVNNNSSILNITPLFCPRTLTNNPLACGCNVFNSIVDVILSVRPTASCASPPRVKGAAFPGNYQNYRRRDFTCGRWKDISPTNNNFKSLFHNLFPWFPVTKHIRLLYLVTKFSCVTKQKRKCNWRFLCLTSTCILQKRGIAVVLSFVYYIGQDIYIVTVNFWLWIFNN